MKGVIQCGGKGMRLRPYTTVLPKPLMPVGSKPVLELLLKWLRRNGVQDVYITTGYLGGRFDMLVQRFVDAWMSFPELVVLIVVVAVVVVVVPAYCCAACRFRPGSRPM